VQGPKTADREADPTYFGRSACASPIDSGFRRACALAKAEINFLVLGHVVMPDVNLAGSDEGNRVSEFSGKHLTSMPNNCQGVSIGRQSGLFLNDSNMPFWICVTRYDLQACVLASLTLQVRATPRKISLMCSLQIAHLDEVRYQMPSNWTGL